MNLTENFKLKEFKSKDGAPFPHEAVQNLKELAENLEVIRAELHAPVTINSGYRSPEHNKKVGGAPHSQHLLGTAADISVSGVAPDIVADTVDQLIKAGKIKNGGLGRYDTFTHYDIRDVPGRWDYRKNKSNG